MTTRIGMITASLNTAMEPATYRLLRDVPDVTVHFSRVRVTGVSLSDDSTAQFETGKMIEAAKLLTDARVDALCWNGTSGGWLGVDWDAELCQAIQHATGVPTTSSTQAITELFRRAGVTRFGLVTPYQADLQQAIIGKYADAGFDCVAESHLDGADGWAYAAIEPETLAGQIRQVAAARPQAITVMCTNVDGAALAPDIERETDVPLFDSIAASLWMSLELAGVDPRRVKGAGHIFDEIAAHV